MEGARGIEPPPGFADRANGFEARGAPSTIAPGFESAQMPVELSFMVYKKGHFSHLYFFQNNNGFRFINLASPSVFP